MQVLPQKRLSIVDNNVAKSNDRNSFESSGFNQHQQRSPLNQTFNDAAAVDKASSNNNASQFDNITVMWGYSPNFNLKRQSQRFSNQEGPSSFQSHGGERTTSQATLKELSQIIKQLQESSEQFGPDKAALLFELLSTLPEFNQTSDEGALADQFEPFLQFQKLDTEAKQAFLGYLKSIDSIDVLEGEETLSNFECLTSFFDQYLCNFIYAHFWAQTTQQMF